ncbi:SWI/SNF chromatin-remodeling complex subunit SNF5-like [Cucurbita pepo subsp. pepo]|uniref:SWI/SNF chromatin-remodeling complex subunit SNF5-like n=1 Tax=Cucurbita pepo subsp. pepo TaxID=3664 RepID=UPI000C9D6DE4|nr:SWI/SNF chromatin-remodeling complex subunit SNF5-like [Cucurbita pepo subsp. pepo]
MPFPLSFRRVLREASEMDEAKATAMAAQHQQQLLLQQHKQQQQQQQQHQQQHQQFLLLQQLQKQQQAQQQAAAISRFPSNIDAHLRPPGLHLRPGSINLHQNLNPNPTASVPNLQSNPSPTQPPSQQLQQQKQQQQQQQQQHQLQQRAMRTGNQAELQMAYQDAWRVCHPDIKRPFGSLEDACERLLPYHVVADYEAEEDDRILDSDPTGQMLSRSQQWDHNISAKISEFIATFEKQVLAFNIITRKRTLGEFRSEERLMFEQALMQEEKRNLLELKAEIELRGKAGREAHDAKMRMAAMMQTTDLTRAEPQANEMMVRGPMRTGAHVGSQSSDVRVGHGVGEQEQVHPNEMVNGWGNNNTQGDDKEASEDLLNDEEAEKGDTGMHDSWREVGEFDLNTR